MSSSSGTQPVEIGFPAAQLIAEARENRQPLDVHESVKNVRTEATWIGVASGLVSAIAASALVAGGMTSLAAVLAVLALGPLQGTSIALWRNREKTDPKLESATTTAREVRSLLLRMRHLNEAVARERVG